MVEILLAPLATKLEPENEFPKTKTNKILKYSAPFLKSGEDLSQQKIPSFLSEFLIILSLGLMCSLWVQICFFV